MQKIGEYWLPDRDTTAGEHLAKSKKSFANGRAGSQIHHLWQALYYIPERKLAIDVGANVGSWTRVLAREFNSVHAFEPVPDTFACLQRNVQEWGLESPNVCLHNEAASDHEAYVSVEPREGRRSIGARITGEGSIKAIPLDSLQLTECSFIKLDVEGHEIAALKGAEKTLARLRPWVMIENKPRRNKERGITVTPDKVIESMGYKLVQRIGRYGIDWLYCPQEQYSWSLVWKKLTKPFIQRKSNR